MHSVRVSSKIAKGVVSLIAGPRRKIAFGKGEKLDMHSVVKVAFGHGE
jgi:hypothetical protein